MLPDFGWTELLMIAIVLIVVVGPKDLPKMLRTFGKATTSLRRMAGDFRKQFDEALKEAELEDVRSIAKDMKSLDPRNEIKSALNPLAKAGKDLNEDLKKATSDIGKPTAPAKAEKSTEDTAKSEAKPKSAGKKPAAATNASKASSSKAGTAKKAAAKTSTAKTSTAKTSTAKTSATKANGAGKPAPAKKPAARKTAAKKTPAAAKPAASRANTKTAAAGDKS